jgi:hypothetical protein
MNKIENEIILNIKVEVVPNCHICGDRVERDGKRYGCGFGDFCYNKVNKEVQEK